MARKVLLEGSYYLNPAAQQVVIGKMVPKERLILITNVTQNKVIYNFSDPSLKATSVAVYGDNSLTAQITAIATTGTAVTFTAVSNPFVVGQFVSITGVTPAAFNLSGRVTAVTSTSFTLASTVTGTYISGGFAGCYENTVVTLQYATASAGMLVTDAIQVTIDEFDERIRPQEELQDPVGKLRVSTPQALIDTDFELSSQASKWETVATIANRPFATNALYNTLVNADIQTGTTGTKGITVSFTTASVATTATGVQGNGIYAMYTTASAHNLVVGQYVTVAGVTPASYNTTSGIPALVLAVPSPTTFVLINATTAQSTVAGTVTSNVAPPVGTPINIVDSFWSGAIGAYTIETRPGETSFTFSSKGSIPSGWASTSIFDPNKTLVTLGQMYSNTPLITSSISNVGQQVTVTTTQPHGLAIGNEISVVGSTASTNAPNGNFQVTAVTSPIQFQYYANSTATGTITPNITATTSSGLPGATVITVASAANIVVGMTVVAVGIPTGTLVANIQGTIVSLTQALTANLSTTTTTFYTSVFTRAQGQTTHRAFDGGVLFSANGSSNNSSLVRQTRRYFRYQSGKGIQMSTGTIFKPTYGIDKIDYGISNAGVVTVQTKERHNLQPGYQVTIYGVNENGYNGAFAIANVKDFNTFTYYPTTIPSSATASGNYYVSISAWAGALNRLGLYEQQNGMFFEFDGQTMSVVRRSSIFQPSGRISVTNGNSTVTQTSTNYPTSFNKQLVPGDFVVIRGQSYRVQDIASDTSMTIMPAYKGPSANYVVLSKTVDFKIPQSAWNLDRLDGTGPSGYNMDLTKMQMFYLDYSWYGAGSVRWGFRGRRGEITYCHKLANNNQNPTAFMRSGNLPGRYETATLPPTTLITATVNPADTTINVQDTSKFYIPSSATTTATGTSGASTIAVNSAQGIVPGMYVNGTNITAGTIVAAISGTTLTLSAANAGAVSGAVTFQNNPGSVVIRSGSTYELINYTGATATTFTGVTRASGGSTSLALSIAVGSNIATVGSATGLQVGQKIVSPSFNDSTFIVYIQGTTLVLSSTPTTASPTVIVAPGGATSGQTFTYSATAPVVVEEAYPLFSPAISHWGMSAAMDGGFTPDKNLLFTYGQKAATYLAPAGGTTATGTTSGSSTTITLSASNTNIVPGMFVADSGTAVPRFTYVVSVTSPTVIVVSQAVTLSSTALTFYGATSKALLSIRVSPSVDNGVPSNFGLREVLNHMQLQVNALDLSLLSTTTGNILVTAVLNPTPYNPTGTQYLTWTNPVAGAQLTPNTSLAQILDYSAMGATGSNMLIQGGENNGGFFTNSTGSVDLSQVRDLGNAIYGGGSAYPNTQIYPDGPDKLTIVATNVSPIAQQVLGRISWTEAQA
jgi:hypothetical protein